MTRRCNQVRLCINRYACVALVWVLGAPGLALAETLTLDDAIRLALERNAGLRASSQQVEAAESQAKAARAGFSPQLNARYTVRRSNNPLDSLADKLNTRSIDPATDFTAEALNHPDYTTLHATEIGVQWPLYTGGRSVAEFGAARAHVRAAQDEHGRARERVIYETTVAYRGVQAAQAGLTVADEAVAAAERHARTTARLLRERRIVASDKLTAEVNLSLVEANRAQAHTRRENALDNLRRALGLTHDAPVTVMTWDADPALPALPPLTELEQQALAQRSDLRAEEHRLRAARAGVRAAGSAFKPQISIGAARTWYDDSFNLDNASNSVMGQVQWNLWSGGQHTERMRAATHSAAALEAQLEDRRAGVLLEVRMAYRALAEARNRLGICADNIGKANKTVELVQGRYGEGRTLLIDLLQAERTLVEARREKLDAQFALARAEAALRYAVGGMP